MTFTLTFSKENVSECLFRMLMSFRSSSDCCWIPEGNMGRWNSSQTRFMLHNSSSRCWCGGRSWCLSRMIQNVAWLLCDFFKTMLFIVETESKSWLHAVSISPRGGGGLQLRFHFQIIDPLLSSLDSSLPPVVTQASPPLPPPIFFFPRVSACSRTTCGTDGLVQESAALPNRACEMRSRWLPRPPKADSLPQHHGLESHTPQDQR